MRWDFDFSFILTWDFIRDYLAAGLAFSLSTTLIATLGGFLFGTILAMMRLSSRKAIAMPAYCYITVMRSIPLIMVLIWFYLVIPLVTGYQIGSEYSALITFTLFEAAYFAEIMRSGMRSVSHGQYYAAEALGMGYGQKMRIVILPQAFRNMVPVLLTQVIILFQDTSLVYAISGYDFFKGFSSGGNIYNRPEEAYLIAALYYFALCFPLSLLVRQLQKKTDIIR